MSGPTKFLLVWSALLARTDCSSRHVLPTRDTARKFVRDGESYQAGMKFLRAAMGIGHEGNVLHWIARQRRWGTRSVLYAFDLAIGFARSKEKKSA